VLTFLYVSGSNPCLAAWFRVQKQNLNFEKCSNLNLLPEEKTLSSNIYSQNECVSSDFVKGRLKACHKTKKEEHKGGSVCVTNCLLVDTHFFPKLFDSFRLLL